MPLTFNLNELTVSILLQHWWILLMQQLISNEQHELFYYNNFRFSSYPQSCNRVYCFWSSSILFCIIHSSLPFQTVKCFAFIFRRNATHFYLIWCFFCKCHLTSFTVNVGIFKNKVLVAKYELFCNISHDWWSIYKKLFL